MGGWMDGRVGLLGRGRLLGNERRVVAGLAQKSGRERWARLEEPDMAGDKHAATENATESRGDGPI